jgi:hypothetical protein
MKVCLLFGLIGVGGLITGFGLWSYVLAALQAVVKS